MPGSLELPSEVAMTISSEVLEKLRSQDWDDLYPRLTFHAKRELQKRGWSIGRFPPPEIANTAINLVLAGKRRWNPAQAPDLLIYLCSVIDSLVGHLPTQMKWIQSLRDMQELTDIEEARLERNSDSRHDPEAAMLQGELEAESEQAFWKFHESLEDKENPVFQRILECFHGGVTKREMIAKEVKVSLHDFDNVRRRLKERVKRAYPKAAAMQAKRR